MHTNHFDYVIVGAGSAGCVLANRLSANPNNRVLLIEAGGRDNYHWIHIPVGYLYCIGNPRTDWLYKTEPDAGLNGRSLRYPRGKVLGGCSSINGMIYMRGQARDYDHWAELTGDGEWNWAHCLADFKKHEGHYKLDNDFINNDAFKQLHGERGEWRVEKQRLSWEILDAFSKAAQQYGIPLTEDFNSGDNHGVGYFEVNQRNGWRWNTTKAFLKPAMKRPNLTVWTDTQVAHLTLAGHGEEKCCTGLIAQRGSQNEGDRVQVLANKEVILCAGSIGTIQILELSGIGRADVLQSHGIEPKHVLTGVGENLQDHLQIRTVYKFKNAKSLNTLSQTVWGKAKIALQYALKRSGPMSMAPSQLGAFTRSDPNRAHPNLEYHVQPLSLDAFGEPLHQFPAFTASVCNLNPTSRGSVHIQSTQPSVAPAIKPNYLSTDADKEVAADSLRITRQIVAQPAFAAYQPEEFKPGVQFQTQEQLVRLAGDIATTIFHPVGTAKMGRKDDATAVVDSRLRVMGIDHLRIVDASVMPTITSGNTNSPTIMMAEKAAAWILKA